MKIGDFIFFKCESPNTLYCIEYLPKDYSSYYGYRNIISKGMFTSNSVWFEENAIIISSLVKELF